jgi:RNA polymerase sigma factor (TIGR02999 family)
MSDVTRILSGMESGDPDAAEKLLPLVYDELRTLAAQKMATEQPDHTLQATALVHEAYVRLVDVKETPQWKSRAHFLAVASIAMRQILVDWARKKRSLKRGGRYTRIDLDDVNLMSHAPPDAILDLDEAIERLASSDAESARVAEMRLYSGVSLAEIAQALRMSSATVHRRWLYARAFLHDALATN